MSSMDIKNPLDLTQTGSLHNRGEVRLEPVKPKLSESLRLKRRIRTVLGIGAMFTLLGLGNILFAHYKIKEYSLLARRAELQAEMEKKRPAGDGFFVTSAFNLDEHSKYMQKLEARLDFYSLVSMGGKCFLSLSGMLFLGCLVRMGQHR